MSFNKFSFLFKKDQCISIFYIVDISINPIEINYMYNCFLYSGTDNIKEIIDNYIPYMKEDTIFIIENIKNIQVLDELRESIYNQYNGNTDLILISTYEIKDNIILTFRKKIKPTINNSDLKQNTSTSYEKIKIVINSHNKSSIALNHLLDSMKINPDFVNFEHIITIGGFYTNKDYIKKKYHEHNDNYENKNYENYENKNNDNKTYENIKYIYCNHNSIDFTGLITLSELDEYKTNNNYYFYMHDTCTIGQNFYKKIKTIDTKYLSTIKIHSRYSMNIGFYSQTIINNFKAFLLTKKNTDENKCMIFKSVDFNEDYIFHNDRNNILLDNYSNWIYSGPTDYYKTGTLRIVEYYPNVDLYKIKANWGLGREWTLNN